VRLADEGAVLLLAARRIELLDEAADEIHAAGHPRPVVAGADLSQPGAAEALGKHALEVFGGSIDILVNNAGGSLTGPQSLIADSDRARRVFEINLWSPLALTAAVLPAMQAAGAGTIVNVTSTMQAVPLPLVGYYGASKAALAQATRSLRLELAETGIRVLEVVPGSTDTALRDIDELPWKAGPPRTLPPVSPQSTAIAMARALRRGDARLVYPTYSLVPLEIPAIGRLVARLGGRRVDTRGALTANPEEKARQRA
jgi:short-subunit dehydrogenase